jgi:flagellar assembly factor FliW
MAASRPTALEVVRFGREESLSVDSAEILTFPRGLIGMEELRSFIILEDERTGPCRWLQSLDDPSLAFVVVSPLLVTPDYVADISDDDALLIELAGPEDAELWVILTLNPPPAPSTVNLLAPVVINRRSRLGTQVILTEGEYGLHHPLPSGPDGGPEPGSAAGPEAANDADPTP